VIVDGGVQSRAVREDPLHLLLARLLRDEPQEGKDPHAAIEDLRELGLRSERAELSHLFP
jgi:hypothetical protein